jgi:hypothetical protein
MTRHRSTEHRPQIVITLQADGAVLTDDVTAQLLREALRAAARCNRLLRRRTRTLSTDGQPERTRPCC